MALKTKAKQIRSLQKQLKKIEKSNPKLAENLKHRISTLEKTKSK